MSQSRVTLHALLAINVLSIPVTAQVVGDAVFLQGEHLEIGIASCGAYGTPMAPPATGAEGTAYHPTEVGLGFVADADEDGWVDGFPPYCGDYFLPGSPVEGFALAIDGEAYANHSGVGICGVEDIPGGIVTYGDGDTVSATWEGVHADGFRLRIRTFFPRGKRYFIGEVTLENTTGAAFEDIYFSRQVDPDNDQAWGGGFQTTNRIVSQPGSGKTDALATAEGSMGCFIGLGARHFASRASRGGFFITNATDPYCGEVPYEQVGSALSDDAIGVNFYFARLAAGEKVRFHYAYILDAEELEEALDATAAPVLLADGLPVEGEDEESIARLTICAGDSLFVEVQGGSNYSWDWQHLGDFRPTSPNAGYLKPAQSGSYGVSSPVPCGDPIQFAFDVVVGNPKVALKAITDAATCPGTSLPLSDPEGLEGAVIRWEPARWIDFPNQAKAVASFDTVDAIIPFEVAVRDTLGCSFEHTFTVTVHPAPQIGAGADKVGIIGTRVSLEGEGGSSYAWEPASYLDRPSAERPSAIVTDTVLFTVTGTDKNGCQGQDQVWVFGLPDQRFALPNAFTPDGDGLHDCYGVGPSLDAGFIDIRIFNRSGEVVFESSDPALCWDGNYQGKPQPIGAYIVHLTVLDENGRERAHTASLTLMR